MASKKRKVSRSLSRAHASMKRRGTLGSYGHHSDAQEKRDIAKGGAIAKKAQFALNMSRMQKRRKKRSATRRRPRTSHR